jgi:hypothetical protein
VQVNERDRVKACCDYVTALLEIIENPIFPWNAAVASR